jgi:hypothetical protein
MYQVYIASTSSTARSSGHSSLTDGVTERFRPQKRRPLRPPVHYLPRAETGAVETPPLSLTPSLRIPCEPSSVQRDCRRMTPNHDFEATFRDVAEAMARPAGRKPEFATIEEIAKHRELFVIACHQTWKTWHERAIGEILVFDEMLRRNDAQPVEGLREYAEDISALWRKVNDAIVWTLFGAERWFVKRLCLHRPRTYLAESNPESVLGLLRKLNANPISFALWNDATSVVDVGDVTYIENGLKPEPAFFEVKEGAVNDEILKFVTLKDKEEIDARFNAFAEARGEKGVKQLQRFIRQSQTTSQMETLWTNLKGTDPVTGLEIEIVDLGVEPPPYDETLGTLLQQAVEHGREVFELVEDCLWVYATADSAVPRLAALARFRALLEQNGVGVSSGTERLMPHDRDRIVELRWGNHQPLAKPIFLRAFVPEIVGSLAFGRLAHKVFMYLDWARFATLCERCGVRFEWSSQKEGRRMLAKKATMRSALFRGRVGYVHVEDGRFDITDPGLVCMYFDGAPPRVIIEKIIAAFRRLKAKVESERAQGRQGQP